MPGRISKYGISLKKKQRRRLRRIVRRRRPSHWLVHRGQIILQSDHYRRITEIQVLKDAGRVEVKWGAAGGHEATDGLGEGEDGQRVVRVAVVRQDVEIQSQFPGRGVDVTAG